MPFQNLIHQPFDVLWKSALVRAPRAVPNHVLRLTNPDGPYPFVLKLKSRGKHHINCYVFLPTDIFPDQATSLPVIIDFHGGGFFLGSPLEQAPFCAMMARELRAVAISVDYRMGPVDKFPAANEDAEDVLAAVLDENSNGYQQLRDAITMRVFENWRDAKATESDGFSDAESHSDVEVQARRPSTPSMRAQGTATPPRRIATPPKRIATPPRRTATPPRQPATPPRQLATPPRQSQGAATPPRQTYGTATPPWQSDEIRRSRVDLDKHRIALSGFSSGGNLALNLALCTTHADHSHWPAVFPADYPAPITLLLFYPSFDSRQLPSERTKPPELPLPNKFWAGVNDLLMPTYLPRDQAAHPRASPGLADVRSCLHCMARILLVLPELDNLAEQSETWVRQVQEADRGQHLRVDRFKGMKHGWTQMPESWLKDDERKFRTEAFESTLEFVRHVWEGKENVAEDGRMHGVVVKEDARRQSW